MPQDPYNFTAPTQPFPVGADSLVGDCSRWRDQVAPPFVLSCSAFTPPYFGRDNVVAPGAPIPLVRVTPIAYSPDTRYLFAQGTAHVGRARRVSGDPWFRGGARSYTNLPASVGIFGAIDTRTNTLAWTHEVDSRLLGTSGPLATAGGLVFRGAGDGTLQAYDARSGAALWRFQTGVPRARGPAMTYVAGGEQYVALAMGTELWAFKLGGMLPEADAPPAGGRRSAERETNEIMTSTLVQSAERGVGNRFAVDEHAFNPPRVRVPARDHRHLRQQRGHHARRHGAGCLLDDRAAAARTVGIRAPGAGRDVHLPLRGASMGDGADNGGAVSRLSTRRPAAGMGARRQALPRWLAALALGALAACGGGEMPPAEPSGDAAVVSPFPPPYHVYVTNEYSGDMTVIAGGTHEVVATIPLGKRPRGIKLSPDRTRLLVALSGSPPSPPGTDESTLPPPDRAADGIGVVDIAAGEVVGMVRAGTDPEQLAISADGARLYVANEDAGEATVVDIATGEVVAALPVGGGAGGGAYQPGRQRRLRDVRGREPGDGHRYRRQ